MTAIELGRTLDVCTSRLQWSQYRPLREDVCCVTRCLGAAIIWIYEIISVDFIIDAEVKTQNRGQHLTCSKYPKNSLEPTGRRRLRSLEELPKFAIATASSIAVVAAVSPIGGKCSNHSYAQSIHFESDLKSDVESIGELQAPRNKPRRVPPKAEEIRPRSSQLRVPNSQAGGSFVNYLPQDEATAAGLGVELSPKDFWRVVASDPSLHGFLDSFLQFRRRWYDFHYHGAKGIVAGVIVGDIELSHRVFMLLYRISSNRDPGASTADSLSLKDHGRCALITEHIGGSLVLLILSARIRLRCL
ncbi:hypothetical protein AKJ16_DCAP23143 [Drosera capensis]